MPPMPSVSSKSFLSNHRKPCSGQVFLPSVPDNPNTPSGILGNLSKMKQFSLNNLNYSHSELEPYELVLYRDENADVTLSFFHLIDGLVEKTVFKAKK